MHAQQPYEKYHPFLVLIPEIEKACLDGVIDDEELKDIQWVIESATRNDLLYDLQTMMIQSLHGIIYGLLADGLLSDTEIFALDNWILNHEFLRGTYPYDEVESILTSVLSDKVVTEDERNTLIATIGDFIDTETALFVNKPYFEELKKKYSTGGICAVNPDITVHDRLFCFTGISSKTNRKGFAETVELKGGKYNDTILNGTDYLVVGDNNNPCWAFSCYGRKVEKAMDVRKSGGKIIIVSELDFWDSLVE